MEQVQVSDTVQAIRNEAERNEVFGAICYDFAQRLRTREKLTVRGLQARMEKQGVVFKKEDYQNALKFLAGLQLGHIVVNSKGQISGLKNIDVTLQSIGKASGLKVTDLERFKPQKRFKKLPVNFKRIENAINKQLSKVKLEPLSHKVKLKPEHEKVYTAELTIKRGDELVTMPGAVRLSAIELGEFLINFANMTKKPWEV